MADAKESRTRWTPEENSRLEAAALPHLLADRKLSIIEAVRRVQDTVLPQERRRTLANIGSLPVGLRTSLDQRRKAASGESTLVDAALLTQAEERIKALEAAHKEASATITALRETVLRYEMQPKPPEPIDVVKDFFADVLRRAQWQPSAGVPPVIISNLNGKHDPEPPVSTASRKPRVLLVGGSSPDHQRIHQEFKDKLEMRYIELGTHSSRIHQMLSNARYDAIGLWVDRVNHAMENPLKVEKVSYRRISGKLDAVREFLQGVSR